MKLFGRRRRLFIDHLQIKLLAINLTYTMAMVLVFCAIIFGPLVVATLGRSSTPEQIAAGNQLLQIHGVIWPAVIVVGLLFSFHSVLYTHRIAGPLYSFRRTLGNVGKGDLRGRAGVRTRDYLRTESEVINAMIDGLSHRVRAVHDATERARRTTRQLAEARDASDPTALNTALERLDQDLRLIAASAAEFQLPDRQDSLPAPFEGADREPALAVGAPE